MPGLNCFEQVKDVFPKLYTKYAKAIKDESSADVQRVIGIAIAQEAYGVTADALNKLKKKLKLEAQEIDINSHVQNLSAIKGKYSILRLDAEQAAVNGERDVKELQESIVVTPSLDIPFDVNGEPTIEWVEKQLGEVRLEIKPGMFANKGQTETIYKVMDFLDGKLPADPNLSDAHNTMMLVEGGAGVGKTTSINKALENFRGNIIGATVSDEARGVLQQNMIGKQTLTIAKLLGLVADQTSETLSFRKRNEKEEKEFRAKFKQDPIESARLVIIDECSMIDAATWKLINEIKPENTKIIFLGDRTQLPPIKEDLSTVFKTFEGTNNYSKLTETMRFAEGAPIFQVTERMFADNIRTQQETGTLPEYNPLSKIDMEDLIANGEAVLYRGYSSEMIDDIATEFKNATGNKDVVVIADMNKSVASLNKLIRARIYEDIEEDYKVGERVRMASPYVTDGMVLAENNLKGTVKEKTESMIGDLPVIKVKIEFEAVNIRGEIQKKTVTVPIIKPGSEGIFQQELERLKQIALKDRPKWRDFYEYKQQFGTIDYAYAMTVHKVQGSTYKSVYVMENEIYRSSTPRTGLELNQMMRTATSRATTKLVIVSAKTSNVASTLVEIPGKKVEPIAPVIQPAAPIIKTPVEPVVDEPGVYKQFGTSYRFNEDGTAGEYRQGNGEWKKMADKTARAKYKELVPQREEKPVDAKVEASAPVTNSAILKPYPGVENIPNTGLTIEKSNEFIDLIQPQIASQAYIENKAVTANRMFSFGLRWAKNVPNEGEKSTQNIKKGTPRPNRVSIKSHNDMTYGYYSTDQNNKPMPSMDALAPITEFIQSHLGIDMSDYDSVLGNIYEGNSFIHQHRDITESRTAEKYPVIVINIGADGGLIFDKETSDKNITSSDAYNAFAEAMKKGNRETRIGTLPIKNGGIYAFGVDGTNRFTFSHRIIDGIGATPTKPITVPEFDPEGNKIGEKTLTDYRITLTFRRSQDLKSEAVAPARIAPTAQAIAEEAVPVVEVKPNTVENIIAALPNSPVEFMAKDEGQVRKLMSQQLVPKTDGTFFSPPEHTEILKTIATITERKLRANPAMRANALLSTFAALKKQGETHRALGDKSLALIFESIDAQRGRIMEDVLREMGSMGLTVDSKTKARILEAVNKNIILEANDNGDFELMSPDVEQEQEEETEDFLESVGRISKDWSDNSFELNPSDTASAKVKQFMSTQLEMDKGIYSLSEDGVKVAENINMEELLTNKVKGQRLAREISRRPFWFKDAASSQALKELMDTHYPSFPKENFMGLSKTADFQQVFKETLTLLGNNLQSATFEDFMSTLKGHPNPTLQAMAEGLDKADQSIKNQFMTVMMKQYQPFTMFTFARVVNPKTGVESYVHELMNANRYNQKTTLVDFWKEQQKLQEIMIDSPAGDRVLNVEGLKERWLPVLQDAIDVKDWTEPGAKEWIAEQMGVIFRKSGIGVTDEMMTEYFKNPAKYGKSSGIAQLFAVKEDGSPAGFLSAFILKSAGMNTLFDESDTEARTQFAKENNPLEKEDLTGIAALVSKYTDVMYSNNHRNVEGKNVWDWGMNTKLSHEFRQMAQQFDAFVDSKKNVLIVQNNWLINHFSDNPDSIKGMSMGYLDGMKRKKAQKGTNRQKMSDREQLLQSVALFQNRGGGFNRKSKVSYMSHTHADKTMSPIFHGMPRIDAGGLNNIPSTLVGKEDSLMFNVFKADFDRIHSTTEQNNRQYNKGRKLFFFIPEFNFDVMKQMVADEFLTQEEFELIWPAGQPTLTESIDSEMELPVINKILEKVVQDRTDATMEAWEEEGLVTDFGTVFDATYMQKITQHAGLKSQVREGRQKGDLDVLIYTSDWGTTYDHKTGNRILAYTAARDYAINQFLFNTALSQLFFGDPAEAYKENKEDKSVMATVQSTFVEYTKRLAKDIAPRADLHWTGDKMYNAITIADVKTKEKYLKGIVPGYAEDSTNSTDAQELTTVQEKLDVLYAAGTIPTTVYNEMTAIVTAGKGGYYEFTKPEHINVIMQPEKPVYAGSIIHGDAQLTDYIKSSAWALYPPMTRGKEVDKLRILMETKGIQRANFESAKKMGNPNIPVTLFDANNKFIEPTDESLQGSWSKLSRDNFGIQQDVPFDADKEAIGVLTQMNENITEGLMDMTDFSIPGMENMNGVEIKAFKEKIRKEMIAYNVKQLDTKWNIDADGNLDFEHMLNMMANEAKNDPRNSYTVNEVQQLLLRDKDGLLSIPLMFGSAADKFERMLHSQINQVVQVKMPGKSFVQASPVGYIFSEDADLSKVVRIGDWDGSPLKTMRPDPNNPKKSLPGQVILPFTFVDSAGNRMKVEDFLVPGTNQLDMTRVPIELLQVVGARIPNQKHSSMLPLEIVGFTDPSLGDLAIVPQAIVKQMGSDFDVDKLYTYRLPYKHNAETNTFQQITDEKGRTKESMQRDYFNIHWSILTHHEMLARVLSPLDKNDLVDEAKELKAPSVKNYNYFDPIAQLKDFQRGKEAKTLVGSTSWAVKNDARIQDKNVRFGQWKKLDDGSYVITDGTIKVKDDITGDVRELGKLSGNGKSYYYGKNTNQDIENVMRSKGDNHVMTQSEAVDNMKNRTLDDLNVTAATYKAVQAFIQLQTSDDWASHSGYWTRLLTQPIIFEFSKMMKQGNDSLSAEFDDNLYQSTVQALDAKYRELLEGEQDSKLADNILLEPELMLRMHEMDGNDFALHQLAALKLFKQLYAIGDKMFKVEALFNQDVSGGGISLFTTLQKAEDLKTLKNPEQQLPLRGAYAVYEGTETGTIFDATVGKANETITQLFPYHQFIPILGRIMTMTGKTKLSVDTQFRALSAYRSMVFSSGKAWWADTQATRARLIYGKESLAHKLAAVQSTPEGAENPFIQGLRTEIGTNDQQGSYVTYRAAGSVTPNERHNMSAGWLRLLLSEDPNMVMLGEDLIRYTYLTGGVQDANSFVQFVPTSYIANTPFSDMLREAERQLTEGLGLSSDTFIVQYLQHNPSTAKSLKKSDFGTEYQGDFPESFNSSKLGEAFYSYYSKEQGKFLLYVRNQSTAIGHMYTRIDTLGNKFTDEYDGDASGGIKSVLVENRAMAETLPGISNGNPLDILNELKNDSLGSFNEGVSGFDQLGIKDGGEKEFMNALDAIRNNTEVPQYVRETANLLHRIEHSPESKAAQILTHAVGKSIAIKTTDNPKIDGQAAFDNSMLINRQKESSVKGAAITFTHEAVHLRLQAIILSAGGDTRILDKDPQTSNYYKGLIEGYRSKFPELAKRVDTLEQIRYEAYNVLRSRLGEDRFNQILDEVNQNKMLSEDHKLVYSLSNLQEMVAHLTTESLLMEHLNGIESGRGTLLSRIWDALMDMISAIARSAGIKIDRNNLLYEALVHTMKLTDMEGTRDVDITQSLLMPNISVTRTDTENEADELNNLFNYTYNRETKTVKTPVSYEITLTNNKFAKPKSVGGQRGKIIAKLVDQKKQLQLAQNSSDLDSVKRTELRIQIKEVQESINLLTRESNLDNITTIAKAQLVWVDKVLAMANPVPLDVNIAIKAASIWENIFDTLYEKDAEEYNSDFAAFSTEAKHKRQRLSNMHSLKALDPVIGGRGITINQAVLNAENLTDISAAEANALTLVRTKSILVQSTANYSWQQANNRDEEIGRNALQLQDLDAEMKAAGLTGEMMVDDSNGEWRLINRVSGSWFAEVKKIRYALDATLSSLSKTTMIDSDRKERVTKAWDGYWKAMKRTAVFVDSRVFFDINTGEKISDSKYDAALEELTAKVGDREHAETLIAEAQAKYKEYLILRDAQKDYIDANTFISEEDMEGKTDDEVEKLTNKRKEDLYNTWLAFNSPLKLLEKINSDKEIGYESHGTEFLVSSPMAGSKSAFNEKFKAIATDPKKLAVYTKVKAKLKEMISYLPMDVQADISEESYLPFVPKDTASFLSRAMDGIRNWNTVLLKELTATDAEEASRLKPDEIPVMYARASGYTKEAENRSKDIVQILSLFSMMALQHKYMGKALDVINVTEGIIKEVNKQRIESPDSGKPLRYISDSLKYFKDTLVFKKPKELEWKVGNKIYNINPAEQAKIVKEIDALTKEHQELTDKESIRWEEMDFSDSPNKERMDEIEKKLSEYEKDARYIYGSKIVDKLISINQLKALAFNPLSAVSNFTFGVMSVAIHARGRIDYTPQQAREAWAIMSHASKKYWMFSDNGDETAQKIHNLMLRTNIMGDITDTAYGESNIKTRKGNKVLGSLHPFNWQKSGDYFSKGVFMIAMMKNKMIEVTDKDTGVKKTMSLWEATGKDGNISDKFEPQEEWNSDDISKQTQWNNYRDRMRKVGLMVFGNQDKNSPLMLKKTAIGRLIAQFRLSWFPEGIATRWKGEYTDQVLERQVKGRWRTYGDLGWLGSSMVLAKQMLNAIPGIKVDAFKDAQLRYSDGTVKSLADSEVDMENMRKNFAGLAMTVSITAMILMLESLQGGDEEHKKNAKARQRTLLLNMLIRNQQDLLLYSSPSVFNTITGNAMPALTVITDYVKAMKGTAHYFFGDTKHEKDAFERMMKKWMRATPVINLYGKAETFMTRDVSKLER